MSVVRRVQVPKRRNHSIVMNFGQNDEFLFACQFECSVLYVPCPFKVGVKHRNNNDLSKDLA
jgi:hypothetical protein